MWLRWKGLEISHSTGEIKFRLHRKEGSVLVEGVT